jgi:cysteinyl-tRNA synthetase
VLRLFDSRSGQLTEVAPAVGRELHLYVQGPAGRRRAHVGDLRVALLADLIRRATELHRLTVAACLGIEDGNQAGSVDEDAFLADCSALNLRPPEYSARGSQPIGAVIESQLGNVIDVHVGGGDPPDPPDARRAAARHWAQAARLRLDGQELAESAGNVAAPSDLSQRGLDPLALRLAFLEHRYRRPLDLTQAALADADATLGRWREQVADWATHPSAPMSAQYVSRITGAFDDDLDTKAALAALRELGRSTQVPPGSKFETFAHVDQLLGLELARDLGRTPPPLPLPEGTDGLLADRAAARELGDQAGADRLRAELAGRGVAVTDTPAGQHWTVERDGR